MTVRKIIIRGAWVVVCNSCGRYFELDKWMSLSPPEGKVGPDYVARMCVCGSRGVIVDHRQIVNGR